MVASGVGVTVLPVTSVPEMVPRDSLIDYKPFKSPDRREVLMWRKSFTRGPAIEVLRRAVLKCALPGATRFHAPAQAH